MVEVITNPLYPDPPVVEVPAQGDPVESNPLRVTIRPPGVAEQPEPYEYIDPGFSGLDATELAFGGPDITPDIFRQSAYQFKTGDIDNAFSEYGTAAPGVLAQQVALEAETKGPFQGLFTYDTLQDGTAPIFERMPGYKGLPPEERKLGDREIIKLFSNVQDRGFFEQLAIEAPKSFMAASGMYVGAKKGAALSRRIPGTTPASAIARITVPVFTTIGGGVVSGFAGEELRKALFGEREPYNPYDFAKVRAAETTAGVLEGIALPYGIGKKGIDLGFALHQKAISELPASAGANLTLGRSERALRNFENLVGDVGKTYRKRPVVAGLGEATVGGVSVAGSAIAAKQAPDSPTAQLVGEIGAPTALSVGSNLVPSRLLYTAVSSFVGKTKNELAPFAEEAAREAGRDKPNIQDRMKAFARFYKNKRKTAGARIIADQLEAGMGSPEEVDAFLTTLGRIASDDTDPDAAARAFREIRKNPVLNTIVQKLEKSGVDFDEQTEGAVNVQARGLLQLLSSFDTGTSEGYRLASEVLAAAHTQELVNNVFDRVNKIQQAFKQVQGENVDFKQLATRLSDSYDQIYRNTETVAGRLYDDLKNHEIKFDLDNEPVFDLDGLDLPKAEDKIILSAEANAAVSLIKRIRREYDDWKRVSLGQATQQDLLTDLQAKFSDEANSFGNTPNGTLFDAYNRRVDEAGSLEAKIAVLDEAIAKGVRNDALRLRDADPDASIPAYSAVTDALETKRAILTLEDQIKKGVSLDDMPSGYQYETLKNLRSQLLANARTKDDQSALFDSRLASELEAGMMDENLERQGIDMSSEQLANAFSLARSYYRARKNVFNRGLLKDMAASDKQGVKAPVDVLMKKFRTVGDETAMRIEELRLAQQFEQDPSLPGTEFLPGGGKVPAGVDADQAEEIAASAAREGLEAPPSIDALVDDLVFGAIVKTKAANAPLDPKLRQILAEEGLLEEGANLKIIPNKVIDEILERRKDVLDLAPNTRRQLEDLRQLNVDIDRNTPSHALNEIITDQQKVWFQFAKGGDKVNFLQVLIKGIDGKKTRDMKYAWDEMLEPINDLQKRAEQDPSALVEEAKKSGLNVQRLADDLGVDPDNYGQAGARRLAEALVGESKKGLKSLIFDYAKDKAKFSSEAGGDYQALYSALFDPPKTAGAEVRMPSLMRWMRQSGVISPQEFEGVQRSFEGLMKLQRDLSKEGLADLGGDSVLARKGVRTLGVLMGGAFQRSLSKLFPFIGGGGSIQIPGYGADLAQQVLLDANAARAFDGIVELLKDPKELAVFVRVMRDSAQKKETPEGFLRVFADQMKRAGIIGPTKRGLVYGTASALREANESEERGTPLPESPRSGALRRPGFEGRSNTQPAPARGLGDQSSVQVPQFNPPSQQFMPQLAQAAQSAAPGPRPTGQANPKQRAGLASLFPNDPILGAGRNVG